MYGFIQMFWFLAIPFNIGPKYSLFYFHLGSWDSSKVVDANILNGDGTEN